MVTKSRVVVVGAGNICNGFLFHAKKEGLTNAFDFLILDNEAETLKNKQKDFQFVQTMLFDADEESLSDFIHPSNWVISLLPPRYHLKIAKSCLEKNCHLFTSSYLTEDIEAIKLRFKEKNLVLLTELGLDPGVDQLLTIHSSNKIKQSQGTIISYKSYAGSYFTSDDPKDWGYRITWNPENVINAGKEETKYLKEGKEIQVPYSEVFQHKLDTFSILDKHLEVYPNRNSLKILSKYDFPSIQTFIRGTIRKEGFLEIWKTLVDKSFTSPTVIPQNIKDKEAFNHFFKLKAADLKILNQLKLDDGSFSEFTNTQQWLLSQLKSKWSFNFLKEEEYVFLVQEIQYKRTNQPLNLSNKDILVFKNTDSLSAMSSIVGKVLAYTLNKVYLFPVFFLETNTIVNASFSIDLLKEVLELAHYSSNFED